MLFAEYVNLIGEDALGWKCQVFEKFPLLIKFIDAREQLSVQVHPDDGYALANENEYGKSEMWYIVDCEPNASIYYGFKHNITQEELKQRALDNTIIEVLNEVTVKKGDTFFIEAGTVHAIGKGILICEIQQNSNCTYRLYDYARKDKYGNLRELHLDKAVAVIDVTGKSNKPSECMVVNGNGYDAKVLCECKYFTSINYTIYEKTKIFIDETSFVSIVIISGSGSLHGENTSMPFVAGESFFVHAGKKEIEISGKCELILTHI